MKEKDEFKKERKNSKRVNTLSLTTFKGKKESNQPFKHF